MGQPHREQQTIPQGQTSSPPKYFVTPTAKARPDQAALATSAEAPATTHRARSRSLTDSIAHHTHTHTAADENRPTEKFGGSRNERSFFFSGMFFLRAAFILFGRCVSVVFEY